jgi:hypothetical protein
MSGTKSLVNLTLAIVVLAAMAVISLVARYGLAFAEEQKSDQPVAVNDYEVDGVEVGLLSVKRISDGSLTVKWEYRNKTNEPKRLAENFDGMGSSAAWYGTPILPIRAIRLNIQSRKISEGIRLPAVTARARWWYSSQNKP